MARRGIGAVIGLALVGLAISGRRTGEEREEIHRDFWQSLPTPIDLFGEGFPGGDGWNGGGAVGGGGTDPSAGFDFGLTQEQESALHAGEGDPLFSPTLAEPSIAPGQETVFLEPLASAGPSIAPGQEMVFLEPLAPAEPSIAPGQETVVLEATRDPSEALLQQQEAALHG